MVPDLRSRRQHARDREVAWMAAAMINARYSAERFSPLLSLVRDWPDTKLCALADRLAPTPGIRKERQAALAAVERIFCGETALKDRIGQISREVASVLEGRKIAYRENNKRSTRSSSPLHSNQSNQILIYM